MARGLQTWQPWALDTKWLCFCFPHLDEVSVGMKKSDKWKKTKSLYTKPLPRSPESLASTWGPGLHA